MHKEALHRIQIAQITTDQGDICGNTQKIIASIERSRGLATHLVVFPELALPGYLSMDLLTDPVVGPDFVRKNKNALHEIAEHTKNMAVIVGFVDFEEGETGPDGKQILYNAAAFIENGQFNGVYHKTLLPTYNIFDESRYFTPGNKRAVFPCRGRNIGIQICEDLWKEGYGVDVSEELVKLGADLLINISASPFHIGKNNTRAALIREEVKRHHVPFIYANAVGGQDGYEGEILFDGRSLVFDFNANLVAQGYFFREDHLMVAMPELTGFTTQLNPEFYTPVHELYRALVFGIKEYFRRTGSQKAIIGLSGGIDSAVVATLAAAALGPENVIGISMPSKFSSEGSVEDARVLAKNLKVNFEIEPIVEQNELFQERMEAHFKDFEFDTADENAQARERGKILMYWSNKTPRSLVLSTGNKTEMALGYTTLYGDMCGGLAVIGDVSKLRVYDLANFVNDANGREIIPESIITKAPSAELRADQIDEASLGSYSVISPLVDDIVEGRKTIRELIEEYPLDILISTTKRLDGAEYKRRQAPPAIRVTPNSFGFGRRHPITGGLSRLVTEAAGV